MASWFNRISRAILNEAPVPAVIPNQRSQQIRSLAAQQNTQTPAVASAMAATYTTAVNTREEYEQEYEKIKGFYLTDTILSNIVDDALTPDISSGEILRVTTENERYRDKVEAFQRDFNLDGIVNEFCYDLLAHGEYTLRIIVEEGQGVVDIIDDVNNRSLV